MNLTRYQNIWLYVIIPHMSENNLKDFISVNSDLGHIQKSKKKRERREVGRVREGQRKNRRGEGGSEKEKEIRKGGKEEKD